MTEQEHRRLDEMCVTLLTRTSWQDEADVLRDCRGCSRPFWSPRGRRAWCDLACYHRHYYATHPDYRAVTVARSLARYHRQRAARAAA